MTYYHHAQFTHSQRLEYNEEAIKANASLVIKRVLLKWKRRKETKAKLNEVNEI
jgi:hypothetical protein